jgi:hypothetical protein
MLAVVANTSFTEKLFFYHKGAEHGHMRTPARGAAPLPQLGETVPPTPPCKLCCSLMLTPEVSRVRCESAV